MRSSLLAVAALATSSMASPAQTPSRPPQTAPTPPPPVFGAGTNVVLVDFVVTDGKGRVVSGLTAADFVVKEDGKERPIVSFRAVDAAAAPQAGPEDIVVEPFPTPSPEPTPRTDAIAVLFVDDAQLSPQEAARLRPGLKKLVGVIGERNGALALVAPLSKISVASEVDGKQATFAAAIDRIQGRRLNESSTYPMSDSEAIAVEHRDPAIMQRLTLRFVALNPGLEADQATSIAVSRAMEVAREARIRREDAYNVILRSLDWLSRQPGRHSVIMVSGGFAWDPDDAKREEVINRSLRANAPIHFLDARGLQGMGIFQGVEYGPGLDRDAGEEPFAFSNAAAGSTDLAADTGGIVVRNNNNLAQGLTRLMDMTSTYYVIGYDPPEHGKPAFHKIKVEVKRKGLEVVARKGYYDPPTPMPSPRPPRR